VSAPEFAGLPVTVDRSYLVSVIDAPTGAIVFLGHVSDPSASQ
jgi:hypothetical protein